MWMVEELTCCPEFLGKRQGLMCQGLRSEPSSSAITLFLFIILILTTISIRQDLTHKALSSLAQRLAPTGAEFLLLDWGGGVYQITKI